jgi:8-oxo-dGTP diphosphatase
MSVQQPELQVLLIERGNEPFKGYPALPGGFVNVSDEGDQGESIEDAANRELREETGIKVDYLEQLCTIGTPGRDPRGRVITVAYMALVRQVEAVAGDDASGVAWHSVRSVLSTRNGLAFDHDKTLAIAYERLRGKIRYTPIGFNLLPPKFAMSELRSLYELILMRKLDPTNFRKRILDMGILTEAGRQEGVPHRAGKLYRFDKRAYDKATHHGFNFEI